MSPRADIVCYLFFTAIAKPAVIPVGRSPWSEIQKQPSSPQDEVRGRESKNNRHSRRTKSVVGNPKTAVIPVGRSPWSGIHSPLLIPEVFGLKVLSQKHRIAITEKAVLFFHRFIIGIQHRATACKRTDQHNQRRFR